MKRSKSRKYKFIVAALVGVMLLLAAAGCGGADGMVSEETSASGEETGETADAGVLTSAEDIGLHDVDGAETNYAFRYDGEEFAAQYIYDNWTIYDSYRITNKDDMKIICQALIDIHPVHGSDMESYRTADDMVYEWQQHNLAYFFLDEENAWKQSAGNVDFDPEDQGKSIEELYQDRMGE